MLREYETIYILRPDISDSDADRITDRVKNTIRGFEGSILEVKNWGKKRLAYEIAHNQKGIYLYWRYAGSNQVVFELERNLRMLEPVLRYLTVKLTESSDPTSLNDIGDEAIPLRSKRMGGGEDRDDADDDAPTPSRRFRSDDDDNDDDDGDDDDFNA